jgi:hypothetical protein
MISTDFSFFSVPLAVWHQDHLRSSLYIERLSLDADATLLEAVARIEFRGSHLSAAIEKHLTSAQVPQVFAMPPSDLPALLRTADQLVAFAREQVRSKAKRWHCICGARLSGAPMLIHPTTIRCAHCGRTVDIDAPVEAPLDGEPVAAARIRLSSFFRESMARGWPVLLVSPRALSTLP